MWGCFLMSGVKILHFLKDWWKSIPIHQNYTMALRLVFLYFLFHILLKVYLLIVAQAYSQRGIRVSFAHPLADFGHPNVSKCLCIMQWDKKELDTLFYPNVYFGKPNSEILPKALSWQIVKIRFFEYVLWHNYSPQLSQLHCKEFYIEKHLW